MSIFKSVLLGGMLLLSSSVALAQVSLSQNSSGSNVFSLVGKKDKACVYYDAQDFEVVKTTAGLFANDVKEVSGQILGVATTKEAPQKNCIIVGTLGHNEWIDQMIAKKKLDVEPLKDRWESYLVQLVRNPLPGVDKALVIVGSDRRGAAYGLLSVSRNIGVSPWYWWADAPIVKKDQLHLKVDKYINDNFGHSMGDKAVCTLGNILFRSIPAAGMAIRYAGDEFIVLLSGVEEESVLATMKEIHNNLSRFNESGIEPFTLSVSMGYAEFGSEDDAEVFLMHMDEKMYEEKRKYHLLKKSDN